MLWYDYGIHYISTLTGLFFMIIMYNLLSNRKRITLKDIIIILLISFLSLINTLTNYTLSKTLIFYILLVSCIKLVYNHDIKKVLVSSLLIYLVVMFAEIIFGMIVCFLPLKNVVEVNEHAFIKLMISTLIMLISLSIFYIKPLKRRFTKLIDYLEKKDMFYISLILLLILLFLSSITFKNALNYASLTYQIINIIIFIVLLIVFIVAIYNIFKKNKAEQNEEILLNFIKKYEYLIDKDRINRHEMLNNLLVLKSFKDKNSKDYSKLIDKMVKDYKSTGSKVAHNLYNLPSGLKGIIYYKLYDMEKENIKSNTNISSRVLIKLDELDVDTYTRVCKIIGILLDNSIEACKECNEKVINIDIFEMSEGINIEISNTAIIKKIDLNRINEKSYSSKGKNRGYGLFLVNKMVDSNKKISIKQEIIDDFFVTTLHIKL